MELHRKNGSIFVHQKLILTDNGNPQLTKLR
jgi:hypothetical protein